VATFSANSAQPPVGHEQELTHPVAAREHCPAPAPRDSFIKRALVAGARKLHDTSFAFPALVKAFRALQRAGINLTPNHFYYPVPDLQQLENREWPTYPPPPGSKFDLRRQVELAWELSGNYGNELTFTEEPSEHRYHYNNGYFEAVDAEVAYCMVRQFKPGRVVEIGTGYSTRVIAAAIQRNAERDGIVGKLISVDPYPERFSQNGWHEMVEQVPKAVQDVDLDIFAQLESGDILFIDSSHVVGVGSDVVREYLEVLPRLKRGVVVHIHDIFLPSDYPQDAVLNRLWFWSEQYLLQAFLSFNREFEVLWGSSAMHLAYPWVLKQCFPKWRDSYKRMPEERRRFVPSSDHEHVWPSSFWMRRV
jgi:predicted O-methyltransferase YrrM